MRGMPPRTAIRPLTAADEKAFIAAASASRQLHQRWVHAPDNVPDFRRNLARFNDQEHFCFVVYLPATGDLAGVITLTHIVRGALHSGYLGYYAFAGYENQGHMTRGMRAVLRHGFGVLKLNRMEANIQPQNLASIALARRCGFKLEGYSPRYLKIGGRWRDHERWAIVRRA